MNKTAIYTVHGSKFVGLLIPKKRSTGYLRAPFGGHHGNQYWIKLLDTELYQHFAKDVFDIDRYVSIELNTFSFNPDFGSVMAILLDTMRNIFEQCDSFIEVELDKFLNIVTK